MAALMALATAGSSGAEGVPVESVAADGAPLAGDGDAAGATEVVTGGVAGGTGADGIELLTPEPMTSSSL
jgi:hypothetical protein